jgi:hypothetical protein
MNIFKKIYGVVDNYLQLGIGSTAHGIADNINGIEAKENGNGTRANFLTGQATIDDHCSNLLDLKQRVIYLEFSFDGATGIVGATIGQYGICHTTGGIYVAGSIYLATGATTGVLVPMYKMQTVCNKTAFSGTVSMTTSGFYVATTSSTPFGWTNMGDGGGTVPLVYTGTIPAGDNQYIFGVLPINTAYTIVSYDFTLSAWTTGALRAGTTGILWANRFAITPDPSDFYIPNVNGLNVEYWNQWWSNAVLTLTALSTGIQLQATNLPPAPDTGYVKLVLTERVTHVR